MRLVSGLILFAFIASHLLNHGLGLISLAALETGRIVFATVWRESPLGPLFLLALLAHLALALHAIYARRRLRMPPAEAVQMLLGLVIPPLLVIHILGTIGIHLVFTTDPRYELVLLELWANNPDARLRQTFVTLVAWSHGCIGLHFWLRLKPWYRRTLPYLFAAALLLPVLALLGFANAGRDVAELAARPGWLETLVAETQPPPSAVKPAIFAVERAILATLGGLLVLTLVARGVRIMIEARRPVVRIGYPDGRTAEVAPGATILEASRLIAIPHAAVCGGRGRCSTCRVRIDQGLEQLDPPSADERKVLDRVGAAPNVRLACQTRPGSDIAVTPLLPPHATPPDAFGKPASLQGQEQEIAILFADIRGFTTLSENKLPYDVVFILNRYFRVMGEAIEAAGGRVDKYIGDGVMALFGLDTNPQRGAAQAIQAARGMALRLDELNQALVGDLPTPLRIGIGIHAGPAIVGEMGYGNATSVTAVGDTVNTASRLEAMTKEFGAQLVLSQQTADLAGVDLSAWPADERPIRGREEPLAIRIVAAAHDLPGFDEPAKPRRRARVGPRRQAD